MTKHDVLCLMAVGALMACSGRILSATADADGGAGGDGSPDASLDAGASDGGPSCSNGGVQPGAPWPTIRRCPSRAASSPAVGPHAPKVAWTVPLHGSVVIGADGTLYVRGANLTALAADGSTRWTQSSITPSPGGDGVGIGRDGTLYAIVDTGALGAPTSLFALRPDGSPAWSVGVGPCIASPFGLALGDDGNVYALSVGDPSCNGGVSSVVAIGPDGQRRWQHSFSSNEDPGTMQPASLPLGIDGNLYVRITVPGDAGSETEVVALRPDGTEAWRTTTPNAGSLVVGPDGALYLDDGSMVSSLSPDGKLRWEVSLQAKAICPAARDSAVGPDGTVYAFDMSPRLHAIRPDGTPAWQFSVAGDIPCTAAGGPIVSGDGTVYLGFALWPDAGAGPMNRRLGTIALNPDGTLLWQADDIGLPIALGGDGTLYISGPGGLSAIKP